METVATFEKTIRTIIANQGADFNSPELHVKVENAPYMALHIERTGRNVLAVSHYYTQNGDLMSDPTVYLFTGYGEGNWVPFIYVQHGLGIDRHCAWLNDDASAVARIAPRQQKDLAGFVKGWSRNLRQQGFAKIKAQKPQEA
jgi:hypothetical protein